MMWMEMSQDAANTRAGWMKAFTGVADRFCAGMAFGIPAPVAVSIYGSLTIPTSLMERKKDELHGKSGAAASQVLRSASGLALHSNDPSLELDIFLSGAKAA
jgi:hypothetical protein